MGQFQKNFLKDKFLGVTEYLANKLKVNQNYAMLIYNEKSLCHH